MSNFNYGGKTYLFNEKSILGWTINKMMEFLLTFCAHVTCTENNLYDNVKNDRCFLNSFNLVLKFVLLRKFSALLSFVYFA